MMDEDSPRTMEKPAWSEWSKRGGRIRTPRSSRRLEVRPRTGWVGASGQGRSLGIETGRGRGQAKVNGRRRQEQRGTRRWGVADNLRGSSVGDEEGMSIFCNIVSAFVATLLYAKTKIFAAPS